MSDRHPYFMARPLVAGLVAFAIIGGPAWGQRDSSSSSSHDQSKNNGEVIRTFGAEGGYRTEVASRTKGKLSDEDRRRALAADGRGPRSHPGGARSHRRRRHQGGPPGSEQGPPGDQGHPRHAAQGEGPDQDHRARRQGGLRGRARGGGYPHPHLRGNAARPHVGPDPGGPAQAPGRSQGVTVVESETIATEVIADVNPIERQLNRAAKFLEENKSQDAAKALALALVRGIEFRFDKDDSPLAAARDAVWLDAAGRSKRTTPRRPSPTSPSHAGATADLPRGRAAGPASGCRTGCSARSISSRPNSARKAIRATSRSPSPQRSRQSGRVTHWWDRINSWFKRHF